ncbi:nucleotidyltransferase family protein [Halomarina pelagica]|uniref:nucleotidyltransferase family protein n=1 Tax=Halomarina pelagica TaxID=2961599 RepID=UPI0020C36C88|nr:nucleotidyltransferase family protein [Halomarina sp. BND7]
MVTETERNERGGTVIERGTGPGAATTAERRTVRENGASAKRRTEGAILERLFDEFNERDVRYVVPRKYDLLPETPRGDVDIYVDAAEFETAIDVCERLGFETPTTARQSTLQPIVSNAAELLEHAVRSPTEAAATLLRAPERVVQLVRPNTSHKQGYVNRKLQGGGVKLDLRNHLAYTSTSDGSQIRVDPSVERRLFDRRRLHEGFYVPMAADELTHLVAHCVFDKHGVFSGYYVDRCDALVEEVTADQRKDEAFRELLSDVFYGADELVYDSVTEGRYDAIRSKLFRFDEY